VCRRGPGVGLCRVGDPRLRPPDPRPDTGRPIGSPHNPEGPVSHRSLDTHTCSNALRRAALPFDQGDVDTGGDGRRGVLRRVGCERPLEGSGGHVTHTGGTRTRQTRSPLSWTPLLTAGRFGGGAGVVSTGPGNSLAWRRMRQQSNADGLR